LNQLHLSIFTSKYVSQKFQEIQNNSKNYKKAQRTWRLVFCSSFSKNFEKMSATQQPSEWSPSSWDWMMELPPIKDNEAFTGRTRRAPHLPLELDPVEHLGCPSRLQGVLSLLLPDFLLDDPESPNHKQQPLKIQKLSGALTNHVYSILNPANQHQVLLRIYGQGADCFVQREKELEWFERMSQLGLGPRLLGTFENGRLEEFLKSTTLNSEALRNPKFYTKIAQSLVHLHRAGDLLSEQLFLKEENKKRSAELWERIDSWLELASASLRDLPQEAYLRLTSVVNLKSISTDVLALKKNLKNQGSICFCHNDLQYGNILQLDDSTDEDITFVDYEYAGFGYREYDIANFFCEWAAGSFLFIEIFFKKKTHECTSL
jgi:thiamine kinase-like enzyme